MQRRSIQTTLSPQIEIAEVHGNLQIKGWEKNELLVRSQDETLNLETQEDQVRLECRGDCQVSLPVGAQVTVGKVHGNLRVNLLEGSLSAEQIQGNLNLRNVAQTQIEDIQGELFVRYVSGDFQVERVLGNFKGRDLIGDCSVNQVSGNLDMRDVAGEIKASVGGNAKVRLRSLPGDEYQISCGGNLHCRLPAGPGTQVQMASGAKNIRVNVPGTMTTKSQESYQLTLGDGDIQVSLTAGGSIYLAAEEIETLGAEGFDLDLEQDFVELSEAISQEIEEQIESQMETLNNHMTNLSNFADQAGLTEEQIDRIMQRTQASTQRATQRAREKMRQAQEKLERKLAAAQRKAEEKARTAQRRGQERRRSSEGIHPAGWPRAREGEANQAADLGGQASQDERLTILRMLEQKKITPQEAERLLSALEGE